MTDIKRLPEQDNLSAAELSADDWQAEVEHQAEILVGMSTQAFTIALSTGEVDPDDWRTEYVAGLIG